MSLIFCHYVELSMNRCKITTSTFFFLLVYLLDFSGDSRHGRHGDRVFSVCRSSDSQGNVQNSCSDIQGTARQVDADAEQHQSKLCPVYTAEPR